MHPARAWSTRRQLSRGHTPIFHITCLHLAVFQNGLMKEMTGTSLGSTERATGLRTVLAETQLAPRALAPSRVLCGAPIHVTHATDTRDSDMMCTHPATRPHGRAASAPAQTAGALVTRRRRRVSTRVGGVPRCSFFHHQILVVHVVVVGVSVCVCVCVYLSVSVYQTLH